MLGIQRVLVRYGLDDVISAAPLLRPLRWLFYLRAGKVDRSVPLAIRIRLALEELGPIFVKFGQAVSTRRDLLPPDIADELAKLQDRVPPFPAEEAIAILDAAYGRPVGEIPAVRCRSLTIGSLRHRRLLARFAFAYCVCAQLLPRRVTPWLR